eukprot:UN01826
MNEIGRIIGRSLGKRLQTYHPNSICIISTRKFVARSKLFTTNAYSVPSQQKITRLHEGHNISTTGDQTSVKTAAKKMIDMSIGCLMVVDEKDEHEIVGVVTERDCMKAISENVSGLNKTIIRDIMTPSDTIIAAKNSISSENCFKIMLSNNIRHLPLVDDDFVVCRVLSIKDVAASMISENDRKVHEKAEEAEFWAWRAQNLIGSPGSYMS